MYYNRSMETIFSKIIRKEIPADIVFENERLLAFRDIHPKAPVHILVIPKKAILNVAALTAEDEALVGEIFSVIRDLAVQEGVAESGYRVVTNSGEEGGQEVQHLHFHLLGGKSLGPKIAG